jgi:methanogenic corrinoid protein MtbC1
MAPSEAAKLVRRLSDAELDSRPAPEPAPDAYEDAIQRITQAVNRFDPPALEFAVRQAMLLVSARTIFDRVFAPTLARIGDAWHAGTLSIAQEHLASEQLGNATRDLLRLLQPDTPLRRVVLACVQDEFHVLPVYGSALHFVQWGYAVVMLGVNTPPEALAHAVASLEPDAVGLSTTKAMRPAQAREMMAQYAAACGPVPWVVGGGNAGAIEAAVTQAGGLITTAQPDAIRDQLDARIRANRPD